MSLLAGACVGFVFGVLFGALIGIVATLALTADPDDCSAPILDADQIRRITRRQMADVEVPMVVAWPPAHPGSARYV